MYPLSELPNPSGEGAKEPGKEPCSINQEAEPMHLEPQDHCESNLGESNPEIADQTEHGSQNPENGSLSPQGPESRIARSAEH